MTYRNIKWIIGMSILLVSEAAFAEDIQAMNHTARVVLSWESIPEAQAYEIQVLEKMEKSEGPISEFHIDCTHLDFDLQPGHYLYRVRAIDHYGRPGQWSEDAGFDVGNSTT